MGTSQDRRGILLRICCWRIDGVVVMDEFDLICKSCVYHAGLQLPDLFSWYTEISDKVSGVLSTTDCCVVCKDRDCGPWIHVKFLELAGGREA